jgi:transcriptional regulator GlxA family with amidase domain
MTARRIGIFLFDDVEELDAVGPYEVLAFWTRELAVDDGFEVVTFSADGGSVTGAKGLVMGAQCATADLGPLEVLVHPGGQGTRPLMRDEAHLTWLREQRETAPLLTSVCTGSLVYAAAGLLAGRPATTHWQAMDELVAADPSIDARPEERYIDDGDVITSSGVSAGIDMALHLVARLVSADRARQVARGIQYSHGEFAAAGYV